MTNELCPGWRVGLFLPGDNMMDSNEMREQTANLAAVIGQLISALKMLLTAQVVTGRHQKDAIAMCRRTLEAAAENLHGVAMRLG